MVDRRQLQMCIRDRGKRGRATGDLVAARPFRLVEGIVGDGDEPPRRVAVLRHAGSTEGYRHGWKLVRPAEPVLDSTSKPFGEHARVCRRCLAEDHNELVATVAVGVVGGAQGVSQRFGDRSQRNVTGLVAEGVVVVLKVVDVDHEDSQRPVSYTHLRAHETDSYL